MPKRPFDEEGYPLLSAPTTLTPPKSVRRTSQNNVQRAPPTTATGSEPINNTELANMQLRRELIKLEYIDPDTNRKILKKEFEKFHCCMRKSTALSLTVCQKDKSLKR
ncbi:hypothetical protein CRE_13676 [Caenorhabditis remanei]|uniref:Uncharacterized protein n=1 Tax=Caenorhabditis remanei TaxID=31234 RepID=E3N7H8_CAERE|nr:hypothetical protein CRE_13676 [Caenorhabditis remanei]